MNELERLVAYLKIQYHNMTTLHRHLSGDPAWFENHEQLGEWYGEIAKQLDYLAETAISLGYQEPGIKDAVLAFGGELLDAQPRGPEETMGTAMGIMRGIAGMMQAAEAIVPVSAQNRLQEFEDHWNIEGNYKIARMLGGKPGRRPPVEDDDDD